MTIHLVVSFIFLLSCFWACGNAVDDHIRISQEYSERKDQPPIFMGKGSPLGGEQ